MCANWKTDKEGYDHALPDLLADRFEEIRTGEGFEAFKHQEYITVLQSIVTFSPSLPSAVERGITHRSVAQAAKSGKISAKAIIREISKLETHYLSRTPVNYVLATSLSLRYFAALRSKVISGCRITFGRYLPTHFRRARSTVEPEIYLFVGGKYPTGSSAARIAVKARSEAEAVEAALDTLDLIRGIWNLYLNLRTPRRMSSGRRKPVNKILLGPAHTLHRPNGTLASSSALWFEDDYVRVTTAHNAAARWPGLEDFEKWVRTKLARHNYRTTVESWIRRYTKALDSEDWNTAFVRLWGLLESLTATGPNDSHKVTVRRALFLRRDGHYEKQVLNHLRNNRNRAVHAWEEAAEIETILYQAKDYVEQLLIFHVKNRYGFVSAQDAARFLDLPPDIPDLQERLDALGNEIRLVRKAITFRSL